VTKADHGLRPVLVIDFGAQYAQLIARRVREANIYSELIPHTMSLAEIVAKQPAAIILSGGPASVYEKGAPQIDTALLESDVPIFGICYGFQLMAKGLGGTVEKTGLREFGATQLKAIGATSKLLRGSPKTQKVWKSCELRTTLPKRN
jgi:GMP synthase (glutamine-hydrolysing)